MPLGDGFNEFLNRKKAGMVAICQNWSGNLETYAKSNAPWKDRTSHARQSLHSGVEVNGDEYTIYLAHGIEYGEALEEGTPAHIIMPKNKKALYWKGAEHPVKKVNHPGSKPYPIVEPTLEKNKDKVKKDVIDWWAE